MSSFYSVCPLGDGKKYLDMDAEMENEGESADSSNRKKIA
jgi:hypothetical protein